jgi:hypothetical protein
MRKDFFVRPLSLRPRIPPFRTDFNTGTSRLLWHQISKNLRTDLFAPSLWKHYTWTLNWCQQLFFAGENFTPNWETPANNISGNAFRINYQRTKSITKINQHVNKKFGGLSFHLIPRISTHFYYGLTYRGTPSSGLFPAAKYGNPTVAVLRRIDESHDRHNCPAKEESNDM